MLEYQVFEKGWWFRHAGTTTLFQILDIEMKKRCRLCSDKRAYNEKIFVFECQSVTILVLGLCIALPSGVLGLVMFCRMRRWPLYLLIMSQGSVFDTGSWRPCPDSI